MGKSKYAPALIELIGKKAEADPAGRFSLPKWWNREVPAAPDPPPGEPGIEPAGETAQPPAEVPATSTMAVPAAEPRIVTPAPPPLVPVAVTDEVQAPPFGRVMRFEGNRILLAVNPLQSTMIVGGLLVALFTAYQVGHHVGRGSALQPSAAAAPRDEIEQALRSRPEPSALDVRPKPAPARPVADASPRAAAVPPRPAAAGPAEPTRKRAGLTYVILETFTQDHKDAAEYAQKWLETKGVSATLEQKGTRWRLISAEGFDYSRPGDEEKCAQFVERVKSLGPACGRELARAGLAVYKFAKPGRERVEK